MALVFDLILESRRTGRALVVGIVVHLLRAIAVVARRRAPEQDPVAGAGLEKTPRCWPGSPSDRRRAAHWLPGSRRWAQPLGGGDETDRRGP